MLKYREQLDEIANKMPYADNGDWARELCYLTGVTWKEALKEIWQWKYEDEKIRSNERMVKWLIQTRYVMRHQLAIAQNITYEEAEKILNLLVMCRLAELTILVYHQDTDHEGIPCLSLLAEDFPNDTTLECTECGEELISEQAVEFDYLYTIIQNKEFEIRQVLKQLSPVYKA